MAEGFQEVTHEVPLESLQDVFDLEELGDFVRRVQESLAGKAEFDVEPKVDGLSVALEYRDGLFVRGATRGDGRVGEDVTEKPGRPSVRCRFACLSPFPSSLVRGEVYMSKKVFEQLNEEREIKGEALFANPRNAAAGSLRQLDPKVAASRKLDIVVFNIQKADGVEFSTHTETLDYLERQQFRVIPRTLCTSMEEIGARIAAIGDGREKFPYDIDGAVVKLNSLTDRKILGSTAKFPRGPPLTSIRPSRRKAWWRTL